MNQKDFQKLYEEYKDKITDADVKRDFDELYSISQTNDVLLVSVVGYVNAGKSTFFNCIVNERQDITETDSKECTIRPCFVFPDSKFSFKTYERSSLGEDTSININNLLNYFVENKDKFISNNLKVKTKDNKDNISDYVRECQDDSKNFLFTSFSIDNQKSTFVSQLKGKKVVFVDMPGNDGKKADDKSDWFYQTILKRTDLVLLVCSSSEEISSSLTKYLNSIRDNNAKVPFILVLNFRDDKATLPSEGTLKSQLDYFSNKLENDKFIIVEKTIQNAHYAHTMRFSEPCSPSRQDVVREYADKFDVFEKELYKNFFDKNKILDIIDANKDNRFQSQYKRFVQNLTDKIGEMQKEEDEFVKNIKAMEYPTDELYNALFEKRHGSTNKGSGTNETTDSKVISDIKDNMDGGWWFWKPRFRKYIASKIKDSIIPKEIQPFIDNKFNEYKGKLCGIINKDFNDTGVVVEGAPVSLVDESKNGDKPFNKELYDKFYRLLYKKFYNSQINSSVYYNAEDLETTLKGLRDKLFTFEGIGVLIEKACNHLKEEVESDLRKARHIEGRKELLQSLINLKSKLPN